MAIATALSLPGTTRQEYGPHAEVHTLSNGLQVVLMEDHSAPVVALQTWVRYGSADEDLDVAGIAHVFEHMLFKGTTNRSAEQIARSVDSIGGGLDAFTSKELVSYNVKGLDEHPEFATAIDLVDTTSDLAQYISEITETFAGIYLANPTGLIAFVHAVTAPSALRLLAPYLTDADARLAARYAWQACAGIYAWYSTTPPPAPSGFTPPTEAPETLIERAVAAGGAHTIKFTEACLREYALNPQPVYLVAARDAAERVGRV